MNKEDLLSINTLGQWSNSTLSTSLINAVQTLNYPIKLMIKSIEFKKVTLLLWVAMVSSITSMTKIFIHAFIPILKESY